MKNKLRIFLLILPAILVFQILAAAQTYEKIADDTFGFLKAGTFAKPSVSKRTNKVALTQVRVHYKFVTTQATETRTNSAKVSAYLDGAMTVGDLQNLTDEFYRVLQKKLGALGIEFVDWSAIQGTEYYKDRQAATDEKSTTNGDVKSGQGWLSYTAFDGPVFMRYGVADQIPEIIAYGKQKKISKMCETLGADFATFDVVLDFTSINLGTSVDTTWIDGTKYLNYGANYNIAPIMSVPQSYVTFLDEKIKFDGYNSKLPVVTRDYFAGKPYEDASKTALRSKTFFGETRFTFTPIVIEAQRNLYIAAARNALNLYADLFVEKLRLIRGGVKPDDSKNVAQNKPVDNTSLQQVNAEAKKNNETTAVTTDEITAAAEQAVKEGKFQLAADYYGELIKKNPDVYQYYLQRGVLYLNELKNAKDAIKDFTKAMELNSDNLILPFNRGTAYIQTSDWKKAKADFDKVLSIRPDYVNAWLNRGIVLLNMKKYDEALADFNEGLRLNPRYPNLYRARAVAFKMKGSNTLAQADELRAAQLERGQ